MGKVRIENEYERRVGAGERNFFPRDRPLFQSCASYFRVPFLLFVPSLLTESLEQAMDGRVEPFSPRPENGSIKSFFSFIILNCSC